MKPHKNLSKIGTIGKAHGLQGYFYMKTALNLEVGETLLLGKTTQHPTEVTLEGLKSHQGKTLLKISVAHDRTELEKYIGSDLWTEREEVQEEDSSDLKQKVYDLDGEVLGECQGFYNHGAGDVIIIENKLKMTLEIPFNEVYFKDQDSNQLKTNFPTAFFAELWQKS